MDSPLMMQPQQQQQAKKNKWLTFGVGVLLGLNVGGVLYYASNCAPSDTQYDEGTLFAAPATATKPGPVFSFRQVQFAPGLPGFPTFQHVNSYISNFARVAPGLVNTTSGNHLLATFPQSVTWEGTDLNRWLFGWYRGAEYEMLFDSAEYATKPVKGWYTKTKGGVPNPWTWNRGQMIGSQKHNHFDPMVFRSGASGMHGYIREQINGGHGDVLQYNNEINLVVSVSYRLIQNGKMKQYLNTFDNIAYTMNKTVNGVDPKKGNCMGLMTHQVHDNVVIDLQIYDAAGYMSAVSHIASLEKFLMTDGKQIAATAKQIAALTPWVAGNGEPAVPVIGWVFASSTVLPLIKLGNSFDTWKMEMYSWGVPSSHSLYYGTNPIPAADGGFFSVDI